MSRDRAKREQLVGAVCLGVLIGAIGPVLALLAHRKEV